MYVCILVQNNDSNNVHLFRTMTVYKPNESGAVGAICPHVKHFSSISVESSNSLYLIISLTDCPDVPNTLQ